MSPREIRLSTTPAPEALAELRLGDIVSLDGLMYTAREGVYRRALEDRANIPLELPRDSAANFHCSPAANVRADGSFDMGAVTATASFRFARWLPDWMEKTGAKLIIGKGGMTLLGRGVESVEAVHWQKELGLAQAMWVIRCNRMGQFIVASDLEGNCLFERENAKIAENIARVYEGTRPAVLKRYGETDSRSDEVI